MSIYLKANIDELIKVLGDIDGHQNLVEINYINIVPKYALVMFDACAYLIFSTSSEGQASVPALMIRQNTPLWNFITRDLDRIRDNHLLDDTHAPKD